MTTKFNAKTFKTVGVRFNNSNAELSKIYSYIWPYDEAIEVGDHAVAIGAQGRPVVVDVVGVTEGILPHATKALICKVDRAEHDAFQAYKQEMNDLLATARNAIKEVRAKELESLLLKKSPKLRKLLEQADDFGVKEDLMQELFKDLGE